MEVFWLFKKFDILDNVIIFLILDGFGTFEYKKKNN